VAQIDMVATTGIDPPPEQVSEEMLTSFAV
jgi:hypothetical protein